MAEPIYTELVTAMARREPVVLATVIDTSRSVPRRPGSKMLVYPSGAISGTVGGGEMESRVIAEALATLVDGRPRRLHYTLVDPGQGDPGVCGGDVELYLEPHMPKPTIYVFGAGHVGRAVIDLARWLDYRVVAWDDRPELAADVSADTDDERIVATGSVTALLVAQPVDAASRVVLVTRNVGLDVELLPALLASPAAYIGVMGSERRWATTRARLLDAGLTEADLDRVHAPIGVEIRAETPAEIAVSILAQIIDHDRGAPS